MHCYAAGRLHRHVARSSALVWRAHSLHRVSPHGCNAIDALQADYRLQHGAADGRTNGTGRAQPNSWSKKTGEAKQLELIGWEISPNNRLDWWKFLIRLLSNERTILVLSLAVQHNERNHFR